MRTVLITTTLCLWSQAARAGELDLGGGLQATKTTWANDRGGTTLLDVSYWFLPWLGAGYIGKEGHANIDDRFLSYLSVNAAVRHSFGKLRLTGTLGVVHQHEEPGTVVMDQPVQSAFGVADGIRHRMAGRAGVSLALPVADYHHGDVYVALDLDGTEFIEGDRGPRWMMSGGLSLGFTYDFSRGDGK